MVKENIFWEMLVLAFGFIVIGCASISAGGTYTSVTNVAIGDTSGLNPVPEVRPNEFGASLSLDSYYFELISTFFLDTETFREEVYFRIPVDIGRLSIYPLLGGGYEFLFKSEFADSVLVDIGGGLE